MFDFVFVLFYARKMVYGLNSASMGITLGQKQFRTPLFVYQFDFIFAVVVILLLFIVPCI